MSEKTDKSMGDSDDNVEVEEACLDAILADLHDTEVSFVL